MQAVEAQSPNMPDTGHDVIRQKILRTLQTYPRISPSMLHIGIGPGIPTSVYKPILEQLIAEGVVQRLQIIGTETGRTATILCLSQNGTEHTLKTV